MPEPIFQDPRFDALRNAIYHTARSKFFDLLNRALNFVVIVLGTAVVGKIATNHAGDNWIEFCVVLFATLQLVFDFGGRAGTHSFLQKRYYDVLADMEIASDVESARAKKKWSAKLIAIAGDETITMRALDALAYNTALDSSTTDPRVLGANRLYVPWWQRLLKNVVAFHGTQFVLKSNHRSMTSQIASWFRHKTGG